MSATKTQVLEEIKNADFDEETYQLVVDSLKDFPEELSNDDLKKMDGLLAEMQSVETIASQVYGELADSLDNAVDEIYDAADDYVTGVAKITHDNVKLAQDLAQ